MMKICKSCNQNKSLDCFFVDPGNKDGRQGKCKSCKNESRDLSKANNNAKKWRNNNLDKAREYRKEYYRRNPERARADCIKRRNKAKVQTPELTKEEKILIRQIYLLCRKISEETKIPHHVDHIIPLCKGGLHHPSNLQIITAEQNLKKGVQSGLA